MQVAPICICTLHSYKIFQLSTILVMPSNQFSLLHLQATAHNSRTTFSIFSFFTKTAYLAQSPTSELSASFQAKPVLYCSIVIVLARSGLCKTHAFFHSIVCFAINNTAPIKSHVLILPYNHYYSAHVFSTILLMTIYIYSCVSSTM